MVALANRIKETTATTGTDDYSLDGAEAGHQAFSVLGNGAETFYVATDGIDWEVGTGTLDTGAGTLARGTIHESSNSGNAVNWGAGSKDIFVDIPAQFFQPYTAGVSGTSTVLSDSTVIEWDNEDYDFGGMVDLGSDADRITFPVEGTYVVSFSWQVSESGTFNTYQLDFNDSSDANVENHSVKHEDRVGNDHIFKSFVYHASAGDYVRLLVNSDGDTAPNNAYFRATLISQPLTVADVPAHAASATLTTEVDPIDNDDVLLSIDSSNYDPFSMVDTINNKIVIPQSGFYEIGFRPQVFLASGQTADFIQVHYRVNGGSFETITYQSDSGGNIFRFQFVGVDKVELSENDEIEFAIRVNYSIGDSQCNVDGKVWVQRIAKPIETENATEWQDATVSGSWSTNVTYSAKKRIVKDTAHYQVHILLSGTPDSAGLTLSLDETIDYDKLVGSHRVPIGTAMILDSGTEFLPGQVLVNTVDDSDPEIYSWEDSPNNGTSIRMIQVNEADPITFTSDDRVIVEFWVPIIR